MSKNMLLRLWPKYPLESRQYLRSFPWRFCMALVVLTLSMSASAEDTKDTGVELLRGRIPLGTKTDGGFHYRKSWALIVGINYEDPSRSDRDRIALPVLRNAENDARELREVLIDYYGYEPENILFNESGSQATKRWVDEQLLKVCDPDIVGPDDSLLVFFSGHGARIDSMNDQGALYPYDVRFADRRPITGTFIRMHSDLVNVVSESQAKHKLLILDSCYSGEVFNVGARPRSETDDRSALALIDAPCLQAITSCRSTQVASDGQGGNSPFTSVLLDGLRQLPARHDDASRIWTNWLFAYMRPDLTLPNGQAPDCRNLSGDGEFNFVPDRTRDFNRFHKGAGDYRLLQASIGSEQGRWWFEEMPWFIPALRETLLHKMAPQRSGIDTLRDRREELRRVAQTWVDGPDICDNSTEENPGTKSANRLLCMRRKHLRRLLEESSLVQGARNTDRSVALKMIASDLSDESVASLLEPVDWHLLAVVQHVLREKNADRTYRKAIEAYAGGESQSVRGSTKASPEIDSHRAMLALCRADFGEFLMTNQKLRGIDAYREAAQLFHDAHDEFRGHGPTSFRISVRIREAQAWLSMNRWAEADRCLSDALDFAKGLGPHHYLGAFVHRERAWAQMTMWQISLAEDSFYESNRILDAWIADLAPEDATAATPVESPSAVANHDGNTAPADDLEGAFRLGEHVRNSRDHQARIVYLHNLHGLAMAQRFHGRTAFAARKYRWLAMECERALAQLRRAMGEVERNAEAELLDRVTNTLERLGDCNLFGDPAVRELSEALDDYQRAESRIHWMAERDHITWQAKLYYKQALALSLPSTIQDSRLAEEICTEADRLFAPELASSTGLEQALGTLTTPIVQLIAANPEGDDKASENDDTLTTARVKLRTTLYKYRTVVGSNPHRDQLELCLFAADVLLHHGRELDRFELLRDIDLLLSFCGIALSPSHLGINDLRPIGEARTYLRPYYDTAMTHMLRLELRDARKMIRVQWEATHGTLCPKDETLRPILAIYVLRGEPMVLFQLPQGDCRYVVLTDEQGSDELLAVSQDSSRSLIQLPRKIELAFQSWRRRHFVTEQSVAVDCRWIDADRRVKRFPESTPQEAQDSVPSDRLSTPKTFADGPSSDSTAGQPTAVKSMKFPLRKLRFPFALPPGFQKLGSGIATEEDLHIPPSK